MSFLNKKILDFTGTAAGLDISDLSVRVVQLEGEGNSDKLVSYGSIELPKGVISDGEIEDERQVVNKIKELLQGVKPGMLKTKKVVCSLPETKAFLRIISIPRMDDKEIKEAIKWEIEANIPLNLDQVYYDWQVLEEDLVREKGKMSVLVVAVAKRTVDKVIAVLVGAGLEPVGLEVESIAQTRSLISDKDKKQTILVVDFDDRITSVLISYHGIPCFTSSIPVSSQSITSAISKGLNLSFSDAEKVKKENGIGVDFKNENIFRSVSSVLENLSSEIERSINFYITELGYSKEIDKIILCGRDARMKGLVPYLTKRLRNNIELGNPWINVSMGKKLPQIDRDISIEYSTAIGLAIKGKKYEQISGSSS